MAVPKRKVSKARRDKRRSNVWKLPMPAFSKCTQCGELRLLTKCALIADITKASRLSRKRHKLLFDVICAAR